MDNDRQFQADVITEVTPEEGGWTLAMGHSCFWCPKNDSGVEPHVGDEVRLYGRGFGFRVRGLSINGRAVFYRTEAQDEAKWKRQIEADNQKRRDTFRANEASYRARIEALPDVFKARFARFQAGNPDFDWEHGGYELFTCEQAVVIAGALKTPGNILEWKEIPDYDTQKKMVPGLDDGHSGNTFGAACSLAVWYLEQPEMVVKMHGALVPLVGCEAYGCTHEEAKQNDQR